MKKITIALVAIFSVAVLTVSCKEGVKKNNAKKEIKIEKQEVHDHDNDMAETAYQCPMDCEHGKTYAKEGNCPVCNMKLKKVAFKGVDKDADSTKVSCKMNYKNCGKSCKGKANCKGNANCKDWASCKGKVDASNKVCSKCQTKNCKGNCKGKA